MIIQSVYFSIFERGGFDYLTPMEPVELLWKAFVKPFMKIWTKCRLFCFIALNFKK